MYLGLIGSLVSALFWTTSYFCVLRRWKVEPEWSCRLIAAVHATLITVLGAMSCYLGPNPFTEPGGPNIFIQDLALSISLGYFIFDTTWCVYYQTEGPTMLLHHFISLVSMVRRIISGYSGAEFVAAMFSFEITNPILQARWFIRSSGYKDTFLYTAVELLFFCMFFVFRIIFSGYLAYTTMIHPRPDYELKFQGIALYGISWVFWIFMVQYFIAKYFRKPRPKKDKEVHATCPDLELTDTVKTSVYNGLPKNEVKEKSS